MGHVHLWFTSGQPVGSIPFTLAPHGSRVMNTVGSAPSGSITVTHDAPYGGLVGKAVAVDPLVGVTFDTPLLPRSR